MDEVDSISLHANTFGKSMNPSVPPQLWVNSRTDMGFFNCLYWESFLRWGFLICVLILLQTFVLILVVFCCFFSLLFGQISPLGVFRWLTVTSDRNAESCNPFTPCFDQVTLWLAWVGIETDIFWQCSPGTIETQCLCPLCTPPPPEGSNYWVYGYKTQHSWDEIWPKHSEKNNKKLPRWGQSLQ